ncbi:MAG: hypothetical protein ACP5GI_03360 [Sulfolobales archaeon]
MGVARRSLLITYVFSVLMILFYKLLTSMGTINEVLQQILSDQRVLYMIVLLPAVPSVAIYIIVKILENDLSKKLYSYNETLHKMRNMIDAYAFLMRRYDENIEDIREKLLNLSSKESDLEKRLIAVEKLLPVLLDLYREKRSD